jgi:hypothetical protein
MTAVDNTNANHHHHRADLEKMIANAKQHAAYPHAAK